MADSIVKKGKQSHEHGSAITTLPRELLVEIMAKVASCSFSDLCMLKLTCKEFLDASEDNYVYQHASLENFALVPLPWFTADKESSFLKRCKESGNMEILYREGMVEYFSSLKIESGLEKLKKAALEGAHGEAMYVYCMILMCSGNDQDRNQGFHLYSFLRNSNMSSIAILRKRVKAFIRSLWIKNSVVKTNQISSCKSCDHSKRVQEVQVQDRWSLLIEDGEDALIGCCESCHAEYELYLFCKTFQL